MIRVSTIVRPVAESLALQENNLPAKTIFIQFWSKRQRQHWHCLSKN